MKKDEITDFLHISTEVRKLVYFLHLVMERRKGP